MIKDRITYPVSEKCCEGCTYCTVVEAQCSPGYKYRKCTANVGTRLACKDLFDEPKVDPDSVFSGITWEDWVSGTHEVGYMDIEDEVERDWDIDEDEIDWEVEQELTLFLDPDDEYWADFH